MINIKDKNFKKFKKIEISYKNWTKIIKKFKKKTKIIIEIFDFESYEFVKRFKNDVDLKISTTELDNFKILNDAIKNFKKIFLNFSLYNKEFINKLISKYFGKKFKNKLVICSFQGFHQTLKT